MNRPTAKCWKVSYNIALLSLFLLLLISFPSARRSSIYYSRIYNVCLYQLNNNIVWIASWCFSTSDRIEQRSWHFEERCYCESQAKRRCICKFEIINMLSPFSTRKQVRTEIFLSLNPNSTTAVKLTLVDYYNVTALRLGIMYYISSKNYLLK